MVLTADNRHQTWAAVAVAAIVAVSAWVRWPGFSQGGFASHDVAGILYNAMVLDGGGLPYVETLEFKPPGSFYLASVLAGPEARDIGRFQIWANLWALAGLVSVGALAWRMWGRTAAVVATALLAGHDAVLDSMDANYVTWAGLPQVLAFGFALEGRRSAGVSSSTAWWLLAGAAAGFATLCKQPAGVILPVVAVMAAVPTEARGTWQVRRAGLVVLGFVLIHVPFGLQYLVHGELGALVDGYVLNRWTLRYIDAREAGWLDSAHEGSLALAHFLAVPLVFAAFAVAAPRAQADRTNARFVTGWLIATLFAASLGARFYKGYFVSVGPPMVLLAAAPWGLLGVRFGLRRSVRALALALALPLVVRQLLVIDATRVDRARPHDLGGRTVAEHVAANTQPSDTIWVWGWHLWDVYPLANRMSASPIYKSLGVLTPPNDDTWRRPASNQHFIDSDHADRLIEDLETSQPAYIVLGSTVPRREFADLQTLLRRDYQPDRRVRIGRVQFWRRKL